MGSASGVTIVVAVVAGLVLFGLWIIWTQRGQGRR